MNFRSCFAVVAFSLALVSTPAKAAVNYYMLVTTKEGPIKTESQVQGLKDVFEVQDYSVEFPTLDALVALNSKGSAHLTIKIPQGLVYAQLLNAYMRKAALPSIELQSFKSTGGPSSKGKFLVYRTANATISHIEMSSDPEKPGASITFSFQNLTMEYFQQKPDGTFAVSQSQSWASIP